MGWDGIEMDEIETDGMGLRWIGWDRNGWD